jgi:hypothetical protein
MHPNTVKDLVRLRPPAIVYVSCNPITQLRDIQLLEKVPSQGARRHHRHSCRRAGGAARVLFATH